MDHDDSDLHIRTMQDRKLAKHITALIDGQKVKIVNYFLREDIIDGTPTKILELVTKIKFWVAGNRDRRVAIEIPLEDRVIKINARFHHGALRPSSWRWVFTVVESKEEYR